MLSEHGSDSFQLVWKLRMASQIIHWLKFLPAVLHEPAVMHMSLHPCRLNIHP